jgi:hypothetical protein
MALDSRRFSGGLETNPHAVRRPDFRLLKAFESSPVLLLRSSGSLKNHRGVG